MFEATNVPVEYAKQCRAALDSHSQGNFFGPSSRSDKTGGLNEKHWEHVDKIFKLAKLPFDTTVTLEDFTQICQQGQVQT